MQIIQGIRDKGAAIVIVVIALSLIGFILMDAKQGANKMFGSNSTNIGKVNGQDIEQAEFNKKVRDLENQEEQRSGSKVTPERATQIREQVWNDIVNESIFYKEADKLGINFTDKELSVILSSEDKDNPLLQDPNMIDKATGKIDQAKLKETFTIIRKAKGDQLDMIESQIRSPQKKTSILTKYFALLNASAYYPSWMEENDKKDKQDFATISYVGIAYNELNDSAYKVTDDEIENYVKKNSKLFKQEAGRKISYVTFSQLPSMEDSAKVKDMVAALKPEFESANNVKVFLATNTSTIDYDSNYLPKSRFVGTPVDSIAKLSPGSVYGPFVDKGSYVLAKYLGNKMFPDSVKARHILIGTNNPQTGEPLLADSVAKKRADSILAAINGGANFMMLALQYSSDEGSKIKGGDLGTFGYGAMVAEFNDYCFTKPAGSKGVVKSQFGYHVIEVESQKGTAPAYKIAFMGKEITPSDVTINKSSNDATRLSAEKDAKRFEAYIQKNALRKITGNELIKENDANIGQMKDARQLVRWAFDAKVGEVSEPIVVGNNFVVAILDKIEKEGTQDVQTARPMAEAAVRIEKKTADILKKLGANPTMESAAAAYSKQVLIAGADSSIVFTSAMINNIGQEPKLIGAAFNKDYQTKASAPIVGKTGIYIIKVNSIGSKAADTPEAAAAWYTQQIKIGRAHV